MRHIAKLIGLSAIVAAFVAPAAAQAADATATGLVDGTVTSGSTVCSWTNAVTSDVPPNTLTIDNATVNPPGGNLGCNDGTGLVLNNDPVVTFNDAAGTAAADAIDVTVTQSGISCRYRAEGIALTRDGTTRHYSGGPYTGNKTGGSFFCPSTATIDTADVLFH